MENKSKQKRKIVPYRYPDKICYLECILKQVLDREEKILLELVYIYIYIT